MIQLLFIISWKKAPIWSLFLYFAISYNKFMYDSNIDDLMDSIKGVKITLSKEGTVFFKPIDYDLFMSAIGYERFKDVSGLSCFAKYISPINLFLYSIIFYSYWKKTFLYWNKVVILNKTLKEDVTIYRLWFFRN